MENEFIYSEEFQSYGDQLKNNLTDYVTLESTVLDGTSVEGEGKATPMGCMQEFLDASLVDDGLTRVKVTYKVATGDIPLEEAADTLIDAASARAMAIADTVIDTVAANTDLICDALSVAFPPAAEVIQFFKPTIKHVVTNVAPKVKEAIHTGIEKVSRYAKEAARPIIAKAREIGVKVKNRILNAIFG